MDGMIYRGGDERVPVRSEPAPASRRLVLLTIVVAAAVGATLLLDRYGPVLAR